MNRMVIVSLVVAQWRVGAGRLHRPAPRYYLVERRSGKSTSASSACRETAFRRGPGDGFRQGAHPTPSICPTVAPQRPRNLFRVRCRRLLSSALRL